MAYQYGMPGQAYVPGLAANQSLAASQMQASMEQQQQMTVQLAAFWQSQMEEIQNIGPTSSEFKTQQLPLTRIKKIMKSDEAVRMISAEAPMLLSKASEIFIHELSLRAWNHAEMNKRRTLQKNDIDSAVTNNDAFDFLVDIIGYPATTAETGGAMGPIPGMAYMPINGAGMPYDATVLGVPTVGVPTSQPVEHAEEQGGQGVGSSGEVNEEGQTSFV